MAPRALMPFPSPHTLFYTIFLFLPPYPNTCQGSYGSWKTWKVMEFRIFTFQAWKVMENYPGSWKVIENNIYLENKHT